MPASTPQVATTQRSGPKLPGPRPVECTEDSRQGDLKHGLTLAGVILPDEDIAEVGRRVLAYRSELKPTGEVGRALALRAALLSIRMERCVEQEAAELSARVRQAQADFLAPEGASPAEADRLRAEAGRRAMFDPSKEATLARRYEAAAERGFFRALKELRLVEREAKAADPAIRAEASRPELGSFFPLGNLDAELARMEAKMDRLEGVDSARPGRPLPAKSAGAAAMARLTAPGDFFELPFAIGRPR